MLYTSIAHRALIWKSTWTIQRCNGSLYCKLLFRRYIFLIKSGGSTSLGPKARIPFFDEVINCFQATVLSKFAWQFAQLRIQFKLISTSFKIIHGWIFNPWYGVLFIPLCRSLYFNFRRINMLVGFKLGLPGIRLSMLTNVSPPVILFKSFNDLILDSIKIKYNQSWLAAVILIISSEYLNVLDCAFDRCIKEVHFWSQFKFMNLFSD